MTVIGPGIFDDTTVDSIDEVGNKIVISKASSNKSLVDKEKVFRFRRILENKDIIGTFINDFKKYQGYDFYIGIVMILSIIIIIYFFIQMLNLISTHT